MEIAIIIIGIAILGLLIYIGFMKKTDEKTDDTGLKLILQQLNEVSRTVDDRMHKMSEVVDTKMNRSSDIVQQSLEKQFSESQTLIREITRELTEVKETGKQVMGFADQLQSLQDILKNPKQRGVLGEYYLETLLKNVLPPNSFQMQYGFLNGEIVDAVVFIKDKVICIDSKFSLENYNKMVEMQDPTEKDKLEKLFVNDLKNRIAETAKYIRPNENTMDFAFMFIPHEAIYYDLLTNKVGALREESENLIQRAASKYKVIIVSPTSFLAYLQTVLQGLKAMQIEETAKDIIKRVDELGKHLKTYEDYHNKLGTSLNTVANHYNASSKELKKVDKDVMRISGTGIELELIDVAKIDREE
jgi:DNA recombination protein RmuC